MITRLSLVTIPVRDQEEALRWFTEILCLKKLQDASYGSRSRWLAVAPPEQSDFGIVLQKPEPAEHGEFGIAFWVKKRIGNSKRACVDLIWWGILLDGWQPENNAGTALSE